VISSRATNRGRRVPDKAGSSIVKNFNKLTIFLVGRKVRDFPISIPHIQSLNDSVFKSLRASLLQKKTKAIQDLLGKL